MDTVTVMGVSRAWVGVYFHSMASVPPAAGMVYPVVSV